MMIANFKQEDTAAYDARFQKFLKQIIEVAGYAPRRTYIYPIMDGIPFKDLEVALDMAVLERMAEKANDNNSV